jgi:hypothetical protein
MIWLVRTIIDRKYRQASFQFAGTSILAAMLAYGWWEGRIYPTLIAIVSFLASIAVYVVGIIKSRRDPYSLQTLQEMVSEGTWDADDVPEVDPRGDLLCMSCQEAYPSRFGTCPHCARRQLGR